MTWGGPFFVIAIIAISTFGWVATSWIRAKHGYPLENEWWGMTEKAEGPTATRQVELLSNENAQLKGQVIPFSARIMNICDQYDALRSVRSYKKSLSHETAVEIITKGDGRTMPSHFDPDILEAFKRCDKAFREIFETITS